MPINEKLDDKSGKYFYDVYVCANSKIFPNLRVQKRKTKIESKNIAIKIEKELFQECYAQLSKEENKGHAWGTVVSKWYQQEKLLSISNIGNDTLQDYFNSMKTWTASIWDKPAFQINRTDIKSIINKLDNESRSKSYQLKIKQTINKIYTWGMEEGLIKNSNSSPTTGISISRKQEKAPEILSLPEVRKLLEAAKQLNHPWYPIWAFAILSGCRNGEIYALTWDDINFDSEFIRVSKSYNTRQRKVKSTKAGYWRNVPINSDLKKLLLELKNNSQGRVEVLPRMLGWDKGNQARELRTFLIGIGLPSVKFHTLRACFATLLLQQNVAPATVMKICGWKDIDTMARYVRLAAIDESGATKNLVVLPKDACENVISLLKNAQFTTENYQGA